MEKYTLLILCKQYKTKKKKKPLKKLRLEVSNLKNITTLQEKRGEITEKGKQIKHLV